MVPVQIRSNGKMDACVRAPIALNWFQILIAEMHPIQALMQPLEKWKKPRNACNKNIRELRVSETMCGLTWRVHCKHHVFERNGQTVAAWFGCRVERSYLQVPAGHPIRAGLVSMKSLWGRGEQERSLAALEAAGFQGAGTPLRLCRCIRRDAGSMGFGESGSLPIGAERLDAGFRTKARGMQRESAAVSLAKMRVVLPRTSCGSR